MNFPSRRQRPRRPAAFTLLEALLLVSILGIMGAGIGTALTAMMHSPAQNNISLAVETALLEKMEYLRAQPFASLAADVGKATSAYTDLPTIEGTPMRRTVSIVYVVPATSVVSAVPTHLLQVSVSIDVRSFVCLVNEP